ncbi:hypothetical protein FYL99_RS26235, partial [Escherichia coli]|nr:hypothetical protein [Escherichia coli]
RKTPHREINTVMRNDKENWQQQEDKDDYAKNEQPCHDLSEAADRQTRGVNGGCRRQPARGVAVRMRPSVRRMILRMRKITQCAGRT